MPQSWQFPIGQPLFTDSLARELVEQDRNSPRKAKAADTRLRFSDAGKCARQIAYDLLGLEGDGMDPASLHVANTGTVYHELLQAAIARRYPGAQMEVKGNLDPVLSNSGHADAYIAADVIANVDPSWDGGDVLFELKTKSTFQFDKAVGVMRKGWKRGTPEGPGHEVILQAALNAEANGCRTLIIGYVCFENFSVGLAEKVGLGQFDRFLAEWVIPYEVWHPMLADEIDRLTHVLDTVDDGLLPERTVYDDDGSLITIDPEAVRPHWRCNGYCSYRYQCELDGPGIVPIPAQFHKGKP